MRQDTERSPLLGASSDNEQETEQDTPRKLQPARRPLLVFCLCALLIFLVEVGGIMQIIPLNEVTEDIICRNLDGRVLPKSASRDRCKEPDVQSELANIQAWKSTIDTIPGLLTAVPYGIVADRFGHSLVLGLSLTGMTLAYAASAVVCAYPNVFHIRLLWLSPMLTLIGGGGTVFTALLYSMVNHVSSEARRSTAFFYIRASMLVGELASNSLTYYLMEIEVWFTIYVGFGIQVLATLLAFAIPSSQLKITSSNTEQHSNNQPPQTINSSNVRSSDQSRPSRVRQAVWEAAREATALVSWVFYENRSSGLLLLTLLFMSLGQYAKVLELQYITKRYGLSWSRAALLLSSRAITSFLLFSVILPLTSSLLLLKVGLQPSTKDLLLARSSLIFMIIGAFGIGLANNLILLVVGTVLLSMGTGYNLLALSLLSSLVVDGQAGVLYSAVGVLDNIGQLIAGPLISAIFRIGLAWGDQWVGLPYFIVGLFYTLSMAITSFVRLDGTNTGIKQGTNEDLED